MNVPSHFLCLSSIRTQVRPRFRFPSPSFWPFISLSRTHMYGSYSSFLYFFTSSPHSNIYTRSLFLDFFLLLFHILWHALVDSFSSYSHLFFFHYLFSVYLHQTPYTQTNRNWMKLREPRFLHEGKGLVNAWRKCTERLSISKMRRDGIVRSRYFFLSHLCKHWRLKSFSLIFIHVLGQNEN